MRGGSVRQQRQQRQQQEQLCCYRGCIRSDYIHYTNEGFGSLARNTIYPILHIASACDLQPYISNVSYNYNSARPNYKTHLPSISKFLSLPDDPATTATNDTCDSRHSVTTATVHNGCNVVSEDDTTTATTATATTAYSQKIRDMHDCDVLELEVNTWNDMNIGFCYGDGYSNCFAIE
jgi:hypothetical protein